MTSLLPKRDIPLVCDFLISTYSNKNNCPDGVPRVPYVRTGCRALWARVPERDGKADLSESTSMYVGKMQ